ncbi:hypothetical protein [Agromyces intestinalis]|uniref:hypothetical protein n=1 Tax=Agromyces intestinalis TaxID=2592652 RepID=UPI00143DD339|nr:hypothetical protein [Agromyces intestinalis]
MSRTFDLVYATSRLRVELADGADLSRTLAFLGTHFRAEELSPAEEPLATLHVSALRAAERDETSDPDDAAGEPIYVRKSASPFFTIEANRVRNPDGTETVVCTRAGTRLRFDPQARRIEVTVSAEGWLDVVELVRDLILRDQENRGAVVLHATAAAHDGGVVLVSGSKGAGKSTILLELVEHFGYRVLSGDKALVVEGPNGIVVQGWPDYPHLGYATITKFDGLPAIAGIDPEASAPEGHAFSPFNKYAVDPVGFRERFPSAEPDDRWVPVAILEPAIGPGEATRVQPIVESAEERVRGLDANDESPFDGTHAGWIRFVPDLRAAQRERRARILAALATVPAWRVDGPGDLVDLPFVTPRHPAHA